MIAALAAVVVVCVALIALLAYVIRQGAAERQRLVMAIIARNGPEMAMQMKAEKKSPVAKTEPPLDPNFVRVGL